MGDFPSKRDRLSCRVRIAVLRGVAGMVTWVDMRGIANAELEWLRPRRGVFATWRRVGQASGESGGAALDPRHEAENAFLGGLGASEFAGDAAFAHHQDAGGEVDDFGQFGGNQNHRHA